MARFARDDTQRIERGGARPRRGGAGAAARPRRRAQRGARLRRACALDAAGERLLAAAMGRQLLSARGTTRVLRVARTIADLAGRESIGGQDVAEAIQFRLPA